MNPVRTVLIIFLLAFLPFAARADETVVENVIRSSAQTGGSSSSSSGKASASVKTVINGVGVEDQSVETTDGEPAVIKTEVRYDAGTKSVHLKAVPEEKSVSGEEFEENTSSLQDDDEREGGGEGDPYLFLKAGEVEFTEGAQTSGAMEEIVVEPESPDIPKQPAIVRFAGAVKKMFSYVFSFFTGA